MGAEKKSQEGSFKGRKEKKCKNNGKKFVQEINFLIWLAALSYLKTNNNRQKKSWSIQCPWLFYIAFIKEKQLSPHAMPHARAVNKERLIRFLRENSILNSLIFISCKKWRLFFNFHMEESVQVSLETSYMNVPKNQRTHFKSEKITALKLSLFSQDVF